jgi:hypothetical protein
MRPLQRPHQSPVMVFAITWSGSIGYYGGQYFKRMLPRGAPFDPLERRLPIKSAGRVSNGRVGGNPRRTYQRLNPTGRPKALNGGPHWRFNIRGLVWRAYVGCPIKEFIGFN